MLEEAGFSEVTFGTATEVHKEQRSWPIFLVTAVRS
jgi:hypothetical protein